MHHRQTALTKPEIAIQEIDRVIASGVRFGCVLADSGYGSSGPFRQALNERGLLWAVGLSRRQNVYPADVALVFPVAKTGKRRVITANHLVGLGEQDFLQRDRIPCATCYEVMQLIVADLPVARRHGLDALAIARTDQSRHIGWAHPRSRLVSQRAKEWRKPLLKIALPINIHGRPSKMPTSHKSQKN